MLLRFQAFLMVSFLILIFILSITYLYYYYLQEKNRINNIIVESGDVKIDPMQIINIELLKRSIVNFQFYCYYCYYHSNISYCKHYKEFCEHTLNIWNSSPGIFVDKFTQSIMTYLEEFYRETGCKANYVTIRTLSSNTDPYYMIYYSFELDCLGNRYYKIRFIGVIDNATNASYIIEV